MVDVVLALLIDPDGRVLLGKRAHHKKAYPGCWDFLGGHVEQGEALADALVREVREESGLVPVGFKHHASFADAQPAINGRVTYHLYVVTRWRGDEVAMCAEHTELSWFAAHEAASLPGLAMPEYREALHAVAIADG